MLGTDITKILICIEFVGTGQLKLESPTDLYCFANLEYMPSCSSGETINDYS